jgi:hypothetical protein
VNEENNSKAFDELLKELEHFFDDIFEKKRGQDAD